MQHEQPPPHSQLETAIKQAALDRLRRHEAYPGYPTVRLSIDHPDVARQLKGGSISNLPDGPWDAGTEYLIAPTEEELQLLRVQGYQFDDTGLPLHPWLLDMLRDPEVGVVLGTGIYWRLGLNKTADPIIFLHGPDKTSVLLIERSDTGSLALPGGFVDPGEDAVHAALRELFEEAGLRLDTSPDTHLYEGVVADTRTTAHAWAHTTALVWHLTGPPPRLKAGDDARAAYWVPLGCIPENLHGSHRALIDEANHKAAVKTEG